MSLSYQVHAGKQLVLVTGHEAVGVADCLHLAEALDVLHDAGVVRPGMRVLVDLRRAVPILPYVGLIHVASRFRDHHRRWLRRTAVLVKGKLAHSMLRQYAALAAQLGMVVAAFHHHEEARAWLELEGNAPG